MNTPEFIEKWLVGYESLEQKLEFETEMKVDLASLQTPCGWYWEQVFDNAQTMHLQEFKSHYESIEPCATSSENYWKQRCEAAEALIESDYNDDLQTSAGADKNVNFYSQWQKIKSNE